MALTTPTTKAINDNIIAQLEASLSQTIPLLPKSFMRVLAKVLAGVFVIIYKYAGFIFLQIFIKTASFSTTTVNGVEISPLTFWGRLIGADDLVEATQAQMVIDITVTNQIGSLPSGSQLINSDNGVTYITVGAVLLNAATVQATVRAVADQAGDDGAGVIGNLQVSDTMSFANALANVSRVATVASITVTGADAETVTVYRKRVIDEFQKRAQGGALSDYESWSEEVAGVLNTYPYTSDSPGQVDVYVESSTEVDGIPTTAQLQAALDSIVLDQTGLASRRPANALANTIAITRNGFDAEVLGLSVDNLATVQASIQTAITEFFLNAEPFIDGLTIPPRRDQISRSSLIGLVGDIVAADNGTFTTVTFAENSNPNVDLELHVLGQGEKAKLATAVTFI